MIRPNACIIKKRTPNSVHAMLTIAYSNCTTSNYFCMVWVVFVQLEFMVAKILCIKLWVYFFMKYGEHFMAWSFVVCTSWIVDLGDFWTFCSVYHYSFAIFNRQMSYVHTIVSYVKHLLYYSMSPRQNMHVDGYKRNGDGVGRGIRQNRRGA